MARATRRKRLADAGFKTTSARDFLGLTDEELVYIEMKVGLARALKRYRTSTLKMSQQHLAELIGSSQSRVAKMEAGDPSVTLDLLIRSMLSTGLKRADIARALGR